MDRRTPIILLIEDDEADRMTLARMLTECGYKVMAASRGADALDTFVIHHRHIALVVSSSRLSDVGRTQLFDALHQIDRRVPVLMTSRASHGDSGRAAFAQLIAEVRFCLQGTPASPPASTTASPRAFNWPLRDEDVDNIEWADVIADEAAAARTPGDAGGDSEGELLEHVERREGLKPTIASADPRNYLAKLSKARRTRRQRIGRIGVTVGAGCVLAVTALLQIRTMTARASANDAAIAAPAVPPVPLFSRPISARTELVHLVPAARLTGINPRFIPDSDTPLIVLGDDRRAPRP